MEEEEIKKRMRMFEAAWYGCRKGQEEHGWVSYDVVRFLQDEYNKEKEKLNYLCKDNVKNIS